MRKTEVSWPQWRGPNRDGHAPESALPARLPETLPAPRWKARVGIGYSSPVVAQGRAIVLGRADGKNESCFCFDAATGRLLWKQSWPSAFAPPDPSAGKGPNATALIDENRVIALGLGGMLHCFDLLRGTILWKHDCAAAFWGVEKSPTGDLWFPICGAAASAMVVGGEIVVPVGGKKAGSFTGFDRRTGALRWKALNDRSSYASPIVTTLGGVEQLVGFTGTRMVGIDRTTHALLWEFSFKALYEQTIVSPVVWKDTVFIGGEARPTTALIVTRSGAKPTTQVAWTSADLSTYLTTPVVVDDRLIGYDVRSRRLVCLDAATGAVRWTGTRTGRLFASLIVAGNDLLFLSDSGELNIVDPRASDYTLKKSYRVAAPETIWSQPALVGQSIYIRDQKELACYTF
jgi:outer membrane protein assembly factor BamB